jgi:hypothetical protein
VLLIDSYNSTFPARLLLRLGSSLLRKYSPRQRQSNYKREQQNEYLLEHVFLLITESSAKSDVQQQTLEAVA